jgi:hypothetical protein
MGIKDLVKFQEIKEIKDSYQIHAICVVYTKLFILKLYYFGLIMKKKKKMYDFNILLGINDLRTFPEDVKK